MVAGEGEWKVLAGAARSFLQQEGEAVGTDIEGGEEREGGGAGDMEQVGRFASPGSSSRREAGAEWKPSRVVRCSQRRARQKAERAWLDSGAGAGLGGRGAARGGQGEPGGAVQHSMERKGSKEGLGNGGEQRNGGVAL